MMKPEPDGSQHLIPKIVIEEASWTTAWAWVYFEKWYKTNEMPWSEIYINNIVYKWVPIEEPKEWVKINYGRSKYGHSG